MKNKSDDIERSDHVQFLIREVSGNKKSDECQSKDDKEPPDELDCLCEGKDSVSFVFN